MRSSSPTLASAYSRSVLRAAVAVACLGAACAAPDEPNELALAVEAQDLTTTARSLKASAPLPTPNSDNGVCFSIPDEYEMHSDWTFGRHPEERVAISAAAVSHEGAIVELPGKSLIGNRFCRTTTHAIAIQEPIVAARIWSSAPIRVDSVVWISVDK